MTIRGAVAFLSLFSLIILTIGCAVFIPKETRYLESAQDRATQEEVRQQLGAPALTASNEKGEAVWVYRVREEQPGNRWTSAGLWCDEYVLTFDQQAILRQWTHRSEFHGGELMPTYCVTGGYASNS
jgi:hypothetical protein